MLTRRLGKSDIEVSALGMGCWAIGGPFYHDGHVVGYGQVDDAESIRAIHTALDMGVTLFDTADAYGCGHSERILGKALVGRHDGVTIATKFGYVPNETTRKIEGECADATYIRQACENSLQRLQIDTIDLYQLHIWDWDIKQLPTVRETLEDMVHEGKIRHYGFSTTDTERAAIFAEGAHFVALQHGLNILAEDQGCIDFCDKHDLASINRGPLAMGILTGKFHSDTHFAEDDMRHQWDFSQGRMAERLQMLDAIRDILTSHGRSLAQGALAWVWARSERTLPIPGFKSVAQVCDNAGALEYGALSPQEFQEVEELMGRVTEGM
ncbi:MAG: aldo/keto reductase [Chloroflexota bacterium]